MDDYELDSGESVTINLKRRKRRGGAAPAAAAARRGIVPVEDEGSRFIRRGGTVVTFHDLGTRLRSVPASTSFDALRFRGKDDGDGANPQEGFFNEYVEIEMERERHTTIFPNYVRASDVAAIDAELLGSRAEDTSDAFDPFGFTEANGSGRMLPNCMPLPFSAEWQYVDLVLYTEGDERRYPLVSAAVRPRVLDLGTPAASVESPKWREQKPKLDEEAWSPVNVEAGVVGHEGALKLGAVKESSVRVETALHYEPFDTGDTAVYKVTQEPSFGAAEVPFSMKGKGKLRIFLRPRILDLTPSYRARTPGGQEASIGLQVFTRLPVYPNLGKLEIKRKFNAGGFNVDPARAFSRSMSALINRSAVLSAYRAPQESAALAAIGEGSFIPQRDRGEFFFMSGRKALAGQLSGVVEWQDELFYVWRKTEVERQNGVGDTNVDDSPMSIQAWQILPLMIYTGAEESATRANNSSGIYQP